MLVFNIRDFGTIQWSGLGFQGNSWPVTSSQTIPFIQVCNVKFYSTLENRKFLMDKA